MNTLRNAYDDWSRSYDSDVNPTRDLSHEILKNSGLNFNGKSVLELGCGTGTVTKYLLQRNAKVTGIDFSDGMLSKAKSNSNLKGAKFLQADINDEWNFGEEKFDIIIVSLVLEHIQDLFTFYKKCLDVLLKDGRLVINELHPVKQEMGSQAKFYDRKKAKETRVPAYFHSTEEFVDSAHSAGFTLETMQDHYSEGDKVPRILSMVFSY